MDAKKKKTTPNDKNQPPFAHALPNAFFARNAANCSRETATRVRGVRSLETKHKCAGSKGWTSGAAASMFAPNRPEYVNVGRGGRLNASPPPPTNVHSRLLRAISSSPPFYRYIEPVERFDRSIHGLWWPLSNLRRDVACRFNQWQLDVPFFPVFFFSVSQICRRRFESDGVLTDRACKR